MSLVWRLYKPNRCYPLSILVEEKKPKLLEILGLDINPIVEGRRIKVLVSKLGLDGHDRGAKVVARALKEAGFDVVYLGVHQTPENVINTAIEEDVDVIGVSILSGSHIELIQDLLKLLKEKKLHYIPIFVGGIIPPQDVPLLKKLGVKEVFGPGTPLKTIIEAVYRIALEKRRLEKERRESQT